MKAGGRSLLPVSSDAGEICQDGHRRVIECVGVRAILEDADAYTKIGVEPDERREPAGTAVVSVHDPCGSVGH